MEDPAVVLELEEFAAERNPAYLVKRHVPGESWVRCGG